MRPTPSCELAFGHGVSSMSMTETLRPAPPAGGGDASALPASGPAPTGTPVRVVGLLALAAVGPILWLFASRFRYLYELWQKDDNYSHGFLVPFVSGYLAWGVFSRQGLSTKGNYPLGIFFLVLGCLLHLATVVIGEPLGDFLGLAAILFGLPVLVGGARWALGFLFPILFLFFMFPLPTTIDVQLAVWLQEMVSTTATWILQVFVPAYQDGNMIVLPGQPLEVGEQCSGLRQVVAFAALTLLVAYFSNRRLAFRIGIVLAGLPVAIVANLLRVLLMAFLTLHFGLESISEKKILAFGISYHTAWGLLTMAIGLALLAGISWWLGRIFPNSIAPAATATSRESKAEGPVPVPRSLIRWLGGAVIFLVLVGLLQQKLVAHLNESEEKVAGSEYLTRSLQGDKGFPVSLGVWDGKDSPPDPPTRPYYNGADDKLNRTYTLHDESDESGLVCQLWMIHYHNATDRRHFPTGCYRGAGYQEDLSERQELAGPAEQAPITKFCFTKGPERRYVSNVYYWHYTLEPPDTVGLSPLQRIHETWSVRRPSLTVQVFTTARTPEQLARVAEFVRLVDEQLHAHLPPGARRGSESLPVTDLGVPRTETKR
jgi:exosortase